MMRTFDSAARGDAAPTYFPPPEAEEGWRSLVAVNQEATANQKGAVRTLAGLDWDRLHEVWRYCQDFEQPHRVLVIRHGWIAGEWGDTGETRGIASCTKSLTALAMAKLFDMSDAGLLPQPITIDDEAWRYLPAAWAEAEPARQRITLRHMLTMTSGLYPYDGPYGEDYADVMLAQPVEAPPGTVWAYNSAPVDLLSRVIEKVTGQAMQQFFEAHIQAPIGGAPCYWSHFGGHTGGSGGGGGPRFLPRELARVGYLVLRGGTWQAGGEQRQVFGAERLAEFTHAAPWLQDTAWRQPNFAFEPHANRYYGHLWWTNRTGEALGEAAPRDVVYMSGWGKQACFVSPSLDMVAIRLGPSQALNTQPLFYHEFWSRLMAAIVDE
ncbi:MAG: serine hydrolase domain-containing protein [Anaerolineae bacterium]